MKMVILLHTLVSGSLLSTLRCGGVLFNQAGSISANIQEMHNCHWMSFVTWSAEKEKYSPNVFSTTQQVFVAPSNTGSDTEVVWCPLLTHLVSQPSSSHTMEQTYSDQSWHSSYAQKIPSQDQVVPKQSSRILLLLTGSSLTESRSL